MLSFPAQSWGSDKVPPTAKNLESVQASTSDEKDEESTTDDKSRPSKTTINLNPKHNVHDEKGSDFEQIGKQTFLTQNTESSLAQEGQQALNTKQDDREEVVIRRVGFVFLAYNVEFWCVSQTDSLFYSALNISVSSKCIHGSSHT